MNGAARFPGDCFCFDGLGCFVKSLTYHAVGVGLYAMNVWLSSFSATHLSESAAFVVGLRTFLSRPTAYEDALLTIDMTLNNIYPAFSVRIVM